jgi:hypothetical protein
MYGTPQPSITPSSLNGSSLGHGIGEWPAPAPRSTGHPRDLMHNTIPPPVDPVGEHLQTARPANIQPLPTLKEVARVSGPPKGTMELMSVPVCRRPERPVASKALTSSTSSPTKSKSSAWAVTMEKALAQDALAATAKDSRPEPRHNMSIPPHLRNLTDNPVQVRPHLSGANLNPDAKVYKALVKREDNIMSEAYAWEAATSDPGTEHAKHVSIKVSLHSNATNNSQGLRMQQEILSSYTKEPTTASIPSTTIATPTNDRALPKHETKVKIMLIRAMEHELDLDRVAPERELMVMQPAEVDRYYDKVCSAHKQWWDAIRKE